MTLNNQRELENHEVNFIFKRYSKYILGYRVNIIDKQYFVVNDAHDEETILKVMKILPKASDEYWDIGNIILFGDFELYADVYHRYCHKKNCFIYNPKFNDNDSVIDFNTISTLRKILEKEKE